MFTVAVVVFVVGISFADGKSSDIGFEAAKAGLQLGVITVFGAAVAQGLKVLDVAREERGRLHEYRLTVFRDTVDAYNKVKTVRRTLRSLGFVRPDYGSLSATHIDGFQAQMGALNEAELAIEKIGREMEAQKDAFPNASARLEDLDTVKNYLKIVLKVWETQGVMIGRNEDAPPGLQAFLARRVETDDSPFWPSFKAFESAIREDLTKKHRQRGWLARRRPNRPRRRSRAATERRRLLRFACELSMHTPGFPS